VTLRSERDRYRVSGEDWTGALPEEMEKHRHLLALIVKQSPRSLRGTGRIAADADLRENSMWRGQSDHDFISDVFRDHNSLPWVSGCHDVNREGPREIGRQRELARGIGRSDETRQGLTASKKRLCSRNGFTVWTSDEKKAARFGGRQREFNSRLWW
jgi:hypothetical protein